MRRKEAASNAWPYKRMVSVGLKFWAWPGYPLGFDRTRTPSRSGASPACNLTEVGSGCGRNISGVKTMSCGSRHCSFRPHNCVSQILLLQPAYDEYGHTPNTWVVETQINVTSSLKTRPKNPCRTVTINLPQNHGPVWIQFLLIPEVGMRATMFSYRRVVRQDNDWFVPFFTSLKLVTQPFNVSQVPLICILHIDQTSRISTLKPDLVIVIQISHHLS